MKHKYIILLILLAGCSTRPSTVEPLQLSDITGWWYGQGYPCGATLYLCVDPTSYPSISVSNELEIGYYTLKPTYACDMGTLDFFAQSKDGDLFYDDHHVSLKRYANSLQLTFSHMDGGELFELKRMAAPNPDLKEFCDKMKITEK